MAEKRTKPKEESKEIQHDRQFVSIQQQRQNLPIFQYRADIIKTIREHQVLIIVGETGSGKSTQISQFLEEQGFADKKMIGITQPRRVGAVSLARRVAEESGSDVGRKVGYAVRFYDKTSPDTKIKYMTDGTLLRECLLDPYLSAYSVIILDEAHERSVHTDILFGLMKVTVHRRPDLKVLITSATLDDEKFANFFDRCPTFFVPVFRWFSGLLGEDIAETSLTVDGIVYVVDPGYVKQKSFNPTTGMESLQVTLISKVAAQQRAGRAGRTRAGKTYRLYTQQIFDQMDDVTIPEIQRSNLSNIVLTLKALDIHDVVAFQFLDPPDPFLLVQAVKHLYQLGALDEEGRLTDLGKMMSAFPLEPTYSRILIGSVDLKCSEEVLTLIAMMSIENLFYRVSGKKHQEEFEELRQELYHAADASGTSELPGDHNLLLYIYHTWKRNHKSSKWCRDYQLQARGLEEAEDIRKQLEDIMHQQKLEVLSTSRGSGAMYDKIAQAMCSGLYMNIARKASKLAKKGESNDFHYILTKQSQIASLHPTCLIILSEKTPPSWVVYVEFAATTRPFIRHVVGVHYEWIEPHLKRGRVDVSKLIGRDVKEILSTSSMMAIEQVKTEVVQEEPVNKRVVEEVFASKVTDNAVDEAKRRFMERRKAMKEVSNPLKKKPKTEN